MRSKSALRVVTNVLASAALVVFVVDRCYALDEDATPEQALEEGVQLASAGSFAEALPALQVAATEGQGVTRENAITALAQFGSRTAMSESLPLAAEYFAAAAATESSDPALAGWVLVGLANVRESMGQPERASEAVELASQRVARAGENCELSLGILLTRANLSLRRREYERAEEYVRDLSAERCDAQGADILRAQGTLTLGAVYRQQGSYAAAKELYAAALDATESASWSERDRASVAADVERSLGEIELYDGTNLEEARQHLLAAVNTHRDLGENVKRAIAESHLAELAHFENDYTTAIEEYRRLSAVFAKVGYADGSARMAYHLGRAISAASSDDLSALDPPITGQGNAAIEQYDAAFDAYTALRDPEWIWRSLFARAEQARRLGRSTDQVERTYDQAIAVFDGLRDDLAGSAQARDLFGETYRRLYERRIELELTKQAPDWVVIDSLTASSRSRELRQNILQSLGDADCRRILEEIASAQRLDTLPALDRAARSPTGSPAPPQISAASENSTLVQYYSSSRGLEISVTDPAGRRVLRPCTTCKTDAELADLVIRFVASLREVAPSDDASELMQLSYTLYDALLAPIADVLTTERVRIVPTGVTELVPFAALASRDATGTPRFFIEGKVLEIVAAPTERRADGRLGARGRARVASIVAPRTYNAEVAREPARDIELHSAIELAGEIDRIFPGSQTYTGPSATKTNLWRALQEFDVVHVGAHANLTAGSPVIELGADAVAKVNTCEIMKHPGRVHAGLVVLAACNTVIAASRATFGDQSRLASLAMAFSYLGVPDVIGTLWDVSAEGTSKALMTAFYRQLQEQELEPAKALALAQRELLQPGGEYAHPYYWSGFVLLSSPNG